MNIVLQICNVSLILAGCVAFALILRYNLHMFQLNGYKNKEHLPWLKKNEGKQRLLWFFLLGGILIDVLLMGGDGVLLGDILLFVLLLFALGIDGRIASRCLFRIAGGSFSATGSGGRLGCIARCRLATALFPWLGLFAEIASLQICLERRSFLVGIIVAWILHNSCLKHHCCGD